MYAQIREHGDQSANATVERRRPIAPYLRMDRRIQYVLSFDIKLITMMRSSWEQTARRPRITRRWWAPSGIHEEENQPL